MKTVIVEGLLADVDGVRHARGCASRTGRSWPSARCRAEPITSSVKGAWSLRAWAIFTSMAREDIQGATPHKETFSTACAAALHGGVVHVADMPNNPAALNASYAAKEENVAASRQLPVTYTLYAGNRKSPLKREVPYKAYMGPRSAISSSARWKNRPGSCAPTPAEQSVSTAKTLCYSTPTALPRLTKHVVRPNVN